VVHCLDPSSRQFKAPDAFIVFEDRGQPVR
jgi:hypothetical protein